MATSVRPASGFCQVNFCRRTTAAHPGDLLQYKDGRGTKSVQVMSLAASPMYDPITMYKKQPSKADRQQVTPDLCIAILGFVFEISLGPFYCH